MLGVWIILSLAAWCLLMFTQTEIAQGSLAVLVAVFALCACWFDLVRGWWLPCVALLQGVSLANTWMPGNAVTNGPVSGCAVALILAAAGSAAAWIFLSRRGGPGTGAAPGHVTAG